MSTTQPPAPRARPLPEPIRIISDIHLGHGATRIGGVGQLRPLFEGAGTVILNGDTAEIRANRIKQTAYEQYEELKALLADMGIGCVVLTGNHDPRITENHYIDLAGGRILVTHGDFLFPYISPWSKKLKHCRADIDQILADCDQERHRHDLDYRLEITRQCCDLLEVIETPKPDGLFGAVRYLFEELWPPTRILSMLDVWINGPRQAAEQLEAFRPGAEVIIVGHTHSRGIWDFGERTSINLGAFAPFVRAFAVDIVGEQVSVYRVEKRENEDAHLGQRVRLLTLRPLDRPAIPALVV